MLGELSKSVSTSVESFVLILIHSDVSRPSFASQVDFAVSNAKPLAESVDFGEESEEWLSIDAEDFDRMLENTHGTGKTSKHDPTSMDVDDDEPTRSTEDRLASQQAKQLKNLANKVETFIEGKGDVEGAIFEE